MKGIVAKRLLIQTDRERYAKRIAVFKSDGAFDSDHVGGDAHVIVVGRHGFFDEF